MKTIIVVIFCHMFGVHHFKNLIILRIFFLRLTRLLICFEIFLHKKNSFQYIIFFFYVEVFFWEIIYFILWYFKPLYICILFYFKKINFNNFIIINKNLFFIRNAGFLSSPESWKFGRTWKVYYNNSIYFVYGSIFKKPIYTEYTHKFSRTL